MKICKLDLTIISSILVSIFPVVTCPLCVTAYVGTASLFGLGITLATPVLLPLMIILLGISLISFWINAKKTKQYKIFVLSLFAILFILLGQFYLKSNIILYTGVAMLMTSSFINIKRRKVCGI